MTNDPQREFALQVVRQLTEAGFQALWAGGCVRDLLLEKIPKDYDVATNARPDQVRQVFGNRRTLAVGESFGVIVVLGPKDAGQVEVATFRTEGSYGDGRRPDEVEFSTAEKDATRRDFTINGMFYDPLTEQVLDFVGGEADGPIMFIRRHGDNICAGLVSFPHFHGCAHADNRQISDEDVRFSSPGRHRQEGFSGAVFIISHTMRVKCPGVGYLGFRNIFLDRSNDC